MATTTVFPNADGTTTNWTTQSGGTTNLYATIDEGTDTPTDADYVIGASTAAVQTIYFQLGDMPVDFDIATAVTIYLRLNRAAGKVGKTFDKVRLVQSDESTAITAESAITTTTTITTVNYSPSITGGTSKTIWDGARLKLNTTSVVGEVYLYAVKVVITYTAAAATGQPAGKRMAYIPFTGSGWRQPFGGPTVARNRPKVFSFPVTPGFAQRNGIYVPVGVCA